MTAAPLGVRATVLTEVGAAFGARTKDKAGAEEVFTMTVAVTELPIVRSVLNRCTVLSGLAPALLLIRNECEPSHAVDSSKVTLLCVPAALLTQNCQLSTGSAMPALFQAFVPAVAPCRLK